MSWARKSERTSSARQLRVPVEDGKKETATPVRVSLEEGGGARESKRSRSL